MNPLDRWRAPIGFWLWIGVTYIVVLFPLHVGWFDWAFFGADFELSRLLHTVTVLYAALAVTASTLPATVNWALQADYTSRSPVIALVALGLLIAGLVILAYLIGHATSAEALTEGVKLDTRQGMALSAVLMLTFAGCTAIKAAAAKKGV